MRPAPEPAKPVYQHQDYPKCMYPSTALLAKGIKRTKEAKSEEDQATLEAQGYQTTVAAPPVVAHTATKEEALAKQKEQFDAAWDTKVSELRTLQTAHDKLVKQVEDLRAEREFLNKRLGKLTEKKPEEKVA